MGPRNGRPIAEQLLSRNSSWWAIPIFPLLHFFIFLPFRSPSPTLEAEYGAINWGKFFLENSIFLKVSFSAFWDDVKLILSTVSSYETSARRLLRSLQVRLHPLTVPARDTPKFGVVGAAFQRCSFIRHTPDFDSLSSCSVPLQERCRFSDFTPQFTIICSVPGRPQTQVLLFHGLIMTATVCHVLALCSNGRRHRHDFCCIQRRHMSLPDRVKV